MISMSTDLNTDEYEIDFEESSAPMSLNEFELDYDFSPLNYTNSNDFTSNEYFKTMQSKGEYCTPPNSVRSLRSIRNRASTPYAVINKSKLWQALDS